MVIRVGLYTKSTLPRATKAPLTDSARANSVSLSPRQELEVNMTPSKGRQAGRQVGRYRRYHRHVDRYFAGASAFCMHECVV